MARPTSSAGASTGASSYTAGSDASRSPPRPRRPISTGSAQPGTAPAQPARTAPSTRQQARPAPSSQQSSSAAAQPARRNDKERSATDKEKDDKDPKTIGPWRIGRTIGKGSSGRVKIAKHSSTGQYAAVKIVPKHALITSRMSINEAGAKVSFPSSVNNSDVRARELMQLCNRPTKHCSALSARLSS